MTNIRIYLMILACSFSSAWMLKLGFNFSWATTISISFALVIFFQAIDWIAFNYYLDSKFDNLRCFDSYNKLSDSLADVKIFKIEQSLHELHIKLDAILEEIRSKT